MSAIHDQAMNYVYQQVVHRLLSYFTRAERTALQLLIQRLVVAAGGMERIGEYKVLFCHSGTQESCYTLAFLRAAQLSIAGRAPSTFQMRVVTQCFNSTSQATLDSMQRSYAALFLYDDPRVEVVMADNREVLPFRHGTPLSQAGREANRLNLLMVGHLRHREAPLDPGDDGYLSTGEMYGRLARWSGGVDALINSDSPRQQKRFLDGLSRAAHKVGLAIPLQGTSGFAELFALLDSLGGDFFRELYSEQERKQWRPESEFELWRRAHCIEIHDLILSNLEACWPLFSEFLGVQPVDLVIDSHENPYLSPQACAHLHGLYALFVEDRGYEAGVTDFLHRIQVMQRRQHASEPLAEGPQAAFNIDWTEYRTRASTQAHAATGLTEAQLLCMLFAPFVDEGAGLETFLRRCHPGMLVAMPDLHRALQTGQAPDQVLQWMLDVSGLPVSLLRRLYTMRSVSWEHGRAETSPATSSDVDPLGELSARQ